MLIYREVSNMEREKSFSLLKISVAPIIHFFFFLSENRYRYRPEFTPKALEEAETKISEYSVL